MHRQKQIAVFGSFLAHPQSDEYRMAEDLGYLLAKKGFKVMCGGHGGIVTPLVSGTIRGGGEVSGISLAEAKQRKRNAPLNPQLTGTVFVGTMAERLELFARADGFIFFSGGIGSLAEFAFTWHALQLAGDFARPVIFLSRAWKHILAEIKRELMIKYKYYGYIHVCERVAEAIAVLANDYSFKYGDSRDIFYKESVFFDLEGAIVESPAEEFVRLCEDIGYFFHLPEVLQSFTRAGYRHGIPEGQKTARDDFSCPITILENLGVDTRAATGIAAYVRKGLKQLPDLYPDVPDTLQHFKEHGFSTGLISSRHPARSREILAAHKLSGLFDVVVDSRECCAGKPAAGPLVEALELSRSGREGMIRVGVGAAQDYADPRVGDCDSILLDRHLDYILDDESCKIRSLRELRFLIKHRDGT